MALDDDLVVYPTTAHFLVSDSTSASKPTASQIDAYVASGTAITGLTELGHTSVEEVVAFSRDGGDSEVKGSLQNRSLKEILTSEAVTAVAVKALQLLDNKVLELHYGGGDYSDENEFALPDQEGTLTKSLLIIIVSGDENIGYFARKTSVRADETIALPADDFSQVPLRFTLLKETGHPRAVWINSNLGTPEA